MTTYWRSSFVLIDTKGLKSGLNFYAELAGATPDVDFAAAHVNHGALETHLLAVTDANIFSSQLVAVISGSSTLPADADITDVAFVQAYLSGAGEVAKYATLRIPAPVVGIFESDLVTVDKTDADLIQFVDDIATDYLVSDGESIDTTQDDGIAGGYWASVKKSTR